MRAYQGRALRFQWFHRNAENIASLILIVIILALVAIVPTLEVMP